MLEPRRAQSSGPGQLGPLPVLLPGSPQAPRQLLASLPIRPQPDVQRRLLHPRRRRRARAPGTATTSPALAGRREPGHRQPNTDPCPREPPQPPCPGPARRGDSPASAALPRPCRRGCPGTSCLPARPPAAGARRCCRPKARRRPRQQRTAEAARPRTRLRPGPPALPPAPPPPADSRRPAPPAPPTQRPPPPLALRSGRSGPAPPGPAPLGPRSRSRPVGLSGAAAVPRAPLGLTRSPGAMPRVSCPCVPCRGGRAWPGGGSTPRAVPAQPFATAFSNPPNVSAACRAAPRPPPCPRARRVGWQRAISSVGQPAEPACFSTCRKGPCPHGSWGRSHRGGRPCTLCGAHVRLFLTPSQDSFPGLCQTPHPARASWGHGCVASHIPKQLLTLRSCSWCPQPFLALHHPTGLWFGPYLSQSVFCCPRTGYKYSSTTPSRPHLPARNGSNRGYRDLERYTFLQAPISSQMAVPEGHPSPGVRVKGGSCGDPKLPIWEAAAQTWWGSTLFLAKASRHRWKGPSLASSEVLWALQSRQLAPVSSSCERGRGAASLPCPTAQRPKGFPRAGH